MEVAFQYFNQFTTRIPPTTVLNDNIQYTIIWFQIIDGNNLKLITSSSYFCNYLFKKQYGFKQLLLILRYRKIKETERISKYLDLARELRKLWNMKLTVIPIVICTLEINLGDLEKRLLEQRIKERIETTEITARILRRDLEIWGGFLSLRFGRKKNQLKLVLETRIV